MLRLVIPSLLATALVCASACEGSKPDPTKLEAKPDNPEKPGPSEPPDKPIVTPDKPVASDSGAGETLETDRPPAPAWFDANKIEHEAVVKQIASDTQVGGGYASALVLELADGTTNEQCIAAAGKTLGETIPELPEPIASGDRLMLQGKADGYDYMIVCGEAKGKRTMFLNFTSKPSGSAGGSAE